MSKNALEKIQEHYKKTERAIGYGETSIVYIYESKDVEPKK